MPAVPIKTPFGATVHRVFVAYGLECDPNNDVALFVIRDKTEKVLFWKILIPKYNEGLGAWTFELNIAHAEAEHIPKGSYKYGVTFYKNAAYDNGMPVDGEVIVPITRKPYVVKEAVAREEGLDEIEASIDALPKPPNEVQPPDDVVIPEE